MRTYQKRYDFGWLEDRLKAIGFQLVYLYRSPESFAAARERRLKVSGNPSQYDDLSQFVDEQVLMERFIDASILPTLRLDISDSDVERATNRIADYLHETGAIWANY